eukprot:CAMPEP_0185845552 /NCGR_PEP_ID=MMETSP1354-20130828/1488_1 /TAXON_ID=708628 /ORGANISM="Erythrolobus madagascarensis, Strain CCMP3276" /LENGTH=410 /DNA_ID=CAMNT_0028545539 /DNA_START=234 /DNA_END=1466 /DNA_ORIENTATION=-
MSMVRELTFVSGGGAVKRSAHRVPLKTVCSVRGRKETGFCSRVARRVRMCAQESNDDSSGGVMDEWNEQAYAMLRDRGAVPHAPVGPSSSLTPVGTISSILRGILNSKAPHEAADVMLRFTAADYFLDVQRIVKHNGRWTELDGLTYASYLGANGRSSVLLSFEEFEFLEDSFSYDASLSTFQCHVLLRGSRKHAGLVFVAHWDLTRDVTTGAWMTSKIEVHENLLAQNERRFVDGPLYRIKPSFNEPLLHPSSAHAPYEVARHVLSALRAMDTPCENHGCEVFLRFASDAFSDTLLHLISYGAKRDEDAVLTPASFRKLIETNRRLHLLQNVMEFAIVEEPTMSEDGTCARQKAVFFSTDDFTFQIWFTMKKDRMRSWRIEDVDISSINPAELAKYADDLSEGDGPSAN